MLGISALAAIAVLMAAPPALAMGCNYRKQSTSASAESYVPEYSPTAASATIEEYSRLQSTPIDPSALVYESDAVTDSVEAVIILEG